MSSHIEISQLICPANQLTGFYMRGTLVVKGLNKEEQYPNGLKIPLYHALTKIQGKLAFNDTYINNSS